MVTASYGSYFFDQDDFEEGKRSRQNGTRKPVRVRKMRWKEEKSPRKGNPYRESRNED